MKRIRTASTVMALFAGLLTTTAITASTATPAQAAPATTGAPIYIAGDLQHQLDVFGANGVRVNTWNVNFTTNDRLAVGDVTGDGVDEILVAGDQSHVIDIFNQNGTILRSFNGNYTFGDGFAVGDVTGDGRDEIIIAGDLGGVVDIFDEFGNRPAPAFNANFTVSDALAVGDFDGSGKDEIVIGGDNSGTIDIFAANGSRPWPAFNGNYTVNDGFAMGKVNGGPSEQLVIAGDQSHIVDVFNVAGTKINSFNGNFTLSDALAVGDVTGDGTDDIVIGGDASHIVDIFDRFGNRPVPAFNGNYTVGDGLAIGHETDKDGDGLLDAWEALGYDADGNGSIDVNLPAMGANPNHKDLFLELDWVTGQNTTRAGIQAMKTAFAAAPVNAGGNNNPDGLPGINLHVDMGSLTDPTAAEDGAGAGSCGDNFDNGGDGVKDTLDPDCLVGDNLGANGRGNDIGDVTVLPLDASFYAVKNNPNNFNPNRKNIFRYAIEGDPNDPSPQTGGRGEIGGNDFIEYNHDGGTIMHELGHTLNLHHGGNVDDNCKPNFVSVMNYDLQFGIPQADGTTIFDYSPPRLSTGGRGTAPIQSIKEDTLNDNTVFDSSDSVNRFIFVNAKNQKVQGVLNGPNNWAGDTDPPLESSNIPINVDTAIPAPTPTNPAAVSPAACANNTTNSTLTGHDDWSVISIPFRQFGDSATGAINAPNEIAPTLKDREAMQQAINNTDVAITATNGPNPVAAGTDLTYNVSVNNTGPNPSRQTVVTDILPSGLTFVSSTGGCVQAPVGTLTCNLGNLAVNGSRAFTITTAVNRDVVYLNGGPKNISNTIKVDNLAGPDPTPANDTATASTQVIAVADLAVTNATTVTPPTEVLIGTSVPVTVRTTVTNTGPSAPMNATITSTSTASTGASVTPPNVTSVPALGFNEVRTVDTTFTLKCAAPGSHTYTLTSAIKPTNVIDTDPNAANNSKQAAITLDCVVPVAINIKPGDSPNPINRNGANVPLSVLTTTAGQYGLPLSFDATKIDPLSVHFGTRSVVNSGGGTVELHGRGHIEKSVELDERTTDSDLDMVLHFPPTPASGLTPGVTEACVKGEYVDGNTRFRFFGCDSVTIIK